jgi:hypothetical protein
LEAGGFGVAVTVPTDDPPLADERVPTGVLRRAARLTDLLDRQVSTTPAWPGAGSTSHGRERSWACCAGQSVGADGPVATDVVADDQPPV